MLHKCKEASTNMLKKLTKSSEVRHWERQSSKAPPQVLTDIESDRNQYRHYIVAYVYLCSCVVVVLTSMYGTEY